MEARLVVQDTVRKPIPNVKSSQCHPLTFSYEPSPSGVDSNLLILLHGLGDTKNPFHSLGKKLATNLPQTAILSLQGGSPVPFLDDQGFGWWDVWDGLGQGKSFVQSVVCLILIVIFRDFTTQSYQLP